MKLEPDNGRGLFTSDRDEIVVPLEDFHGVPHAGEEPHDAVLPEAQTVGMGPTGGAGYVAAPVTKGD